MDRFDVEQQMMACWNVTDDLNMVYEHIMEGDLDRDRLANMVLGISELYNLRFTKLLSTFEQTVKEKTFYGSDDQANPNYQTHFEEDEILGRFSV